jgi:hypothetical protein
MFEESRAAFSKKYSMSVLRQRLVPPILIGLGHRPSLIHRSKVDFDMQNSVRISDLLIKENKCSNLGFHKKLSVKTQSESASLARLAASLLSIWFRVLRSIPMFSGKEALHYDPYIINSADSALTAVLSLLD